MDDFVFRVKKGVDFCKIKSDEIIGVAVSGGADSSALLVALTDIFEKSKIRVITIDHNIRPSNESSADASAVEDLCKKLGVSLKKIEFEKGLVKKIAKNRDSGTEEAARVLRYKAFLDFSKENKITSFCTAHTKNDQLETLLMLFLQGSSEGGGIPFRRGIFCRPLLEISRNEIEDFLKMRNISWQTDSTNENTAFLRNRIRKNLIPFLDEHFFGWQNAVLSGAEKSAWKSEAILEKAKSAMDKIEKSENGVFVKRQTFDSLEKALRLKMLHALLDSFDFSARFPHKILKHFVLLEKNEKKIAEFSDFLIEANDSFVGISKKSKKTSEIESGFFAFIEKESDFFVNETHFFYQNGFLFAENRPLVKINAPFVIRSVENSDFLKDKDEKLRSAQKILSNWKVGSKKSKIPLVQAFPSQKIVALLGSLFGFPDWILDEFKA